MKQKVKITLIHSLLLTISGLLSLILAIVVNNALHIKIIDRNVVQIAQQSCIEIEGIDVLEGCK